MSSMSPYVQNLIKNGIPACNHPFPGGNGHPTVTLVHDGKLWLYDHDDNTGVDKVHQIRVPEGYCLAPHPGSFTLGGESVPVDLGTTVSIINERIPDATIVVKNKNISVVENGAPEGSTR